MSFEWSIPEPNESPGQRRQLSVTIDARHGLLTRAQQMFRETTLPPNAKPVDFEMLDKVATAAWSFLELNPRNANVVDASDCDMTTYVHTSNPELWMVNYGSASLKTTVRIIVDVGANIIKYAQ